MVECSVCWSNKRNENVALMFLCSDDVIRRLRDVGVIYDLLPTEEGRIIICKKCHNDLLKEMDRNAFPKMSQRLFGSVFK